MITVTVPPVRALKITCASNNSRTQKMNSFKRSFTNDVNKKLRKATVDEITSSVDKLLKNEVAETRSIFKKQNDFFKHEIEELQELIAAKLDDCKDTNEVEDDDDDFFESEVLSS